MSARALHPNRTSTLGAAFAAHRCALRELTWSFSGSLALTALILSAGSLTGSLPCASTVALWSLVTCGIIATQLAGRDVPWGWLMLVCLQPLWIAYAFSTEQYGFALGSVAYGIGQLRGFLRSRGECGR